MTTTLHDLTVNPARPKAWKVLVIEDDPNWRSLLELRLEEDGHTVLAAADGLAGLALAEEKPDVILCDIDMPRLNGFGVLEALRQQPDAARHPVHFPDRQVQPRRPAQGHGARRGRLHHQTLPI